MTGGWLFGYVAALRRQGIETVIVCVVEAGHVNAENRARTDGSAYRGRTGTRNLRAAAAPDDGSLRHLAPCDVRDHVERVATVVAAGASRRAVSCDAAWRCRARDPARRLQGDHLPGVRVPAVRRGDPDRRVPEDSRCSRRSRGAPGIGVASNAGCGRAR